MDNQVTMTLTSHNLAERLGLVVVGPDIPIKSVVSLAAISEGSLCFDKSYEVCALDVEATVIVEVCEDAGFGSAILSPTPRLDFARALAWIDDQNGFLHDVIEPQIHPTAIIGKGTVLSSGVKVGAKTVIHHNVVIGEGVQIGERCVIKSGSVIGEDGFGFERDEKGVPIRLVHLGSVKIGNDVEIGSLTTVCRGTLGNTTIEDFAKIDDHVHVAHNVMVRRSAMIVACAEVSGGVEVGEGSWIGPNASIIQQRKIGRNALVGIGANVLKDVADSEIVAGNPAKVLVKK